MARRFNTVWALDQHSQAKHQILRGYLNAWLPIMGKSNASLVYVDGFAGPGRYAGGEPGSPIVALTAALEHRAQLQCELVYLFIEKDAARKAELEAEVAQLSLPANIQVNIEEGRFDETMQRELEEVQGSPLVPIFAFVDPFGWSQTPLALIRRLLDTSPKAELLINFMYEEVNRFLSVPEHSDKWDRLFGTTEWRSIIGITGAAARRAAIHDLYQRQLRAAGAKYVWSFEMRNRHRTTDYFLFFATKSLTGLAKMKEAMWAVDRSGGFVFADPRSGGLPLELDFAPNYLLLRRLILERFGGREASVEEVERYVVAETPFLTTHYKTAVLAKLEGERPAGLEMVRAKTGRRRGTFPSGTVVRFVARDPDITSVRDGTVSMATEQVAGPAQPTMRARFKSGGVLYLPDRPDLEAHVRDQGHGKGFITRVFIVGVSDPIREVKTEAGVKWKEAVRQAATVLAGIEA